MKRIFLALAVLPLMAGCGSEGLAPISGVVTLEGKPLAGASVHFEPIASGQGSEAGIGSYATTDENGRYELKTVDEDATGAVVGKHRVKISIAVADEEDDSGQTMTDKVPLWYNVKTTLTFDVPEGGTESADFKLTTKRPEGWQPDY